VPEDIVVCDEWEAVARLCRERGKRIVYVLGAADRGKTTFCRWIARELAAQARTGVLDCDIGQSTIGPPATVGLAVCGPGSGAPVGVWLRFVGAVTPSGHMVQEMAGASRLKEKAFQEGASFLVIDSPGWVVEPAAQEFQVRMIDLLQPDLVVGIQKGQELEGILVNFRRHPRIGILELPVSPSAVERKRDWRRAYRHQRFTGYFEGAAPYTCGLAGIGVHGRMPDSFREEAWRDLLIALCDPEMMVVTLALVDRLDLAQGTLSFRAPPHDRTRVASVHVGSLRVDLTNPPGRAEPGTHQPAAQPEPAPGGGGHAPPARAPPAPGGGGGQGQSVPGQSS